MGRNQNRDFLHVDCVRNEMTSCKLYIIVVERRQHTVLSKT